jgi:hypothetical protein
MSPTEQLDQDRAAEASCEYTFHPPKELASDDPEVLRAALRRESIERRRAECRRILRRPGQDRRRRERKQYLRGMAARRVESEM